jgi:hypothetical protein
MKGVAVTQTQKGNQQQDRHGPPVLQIEGISLNPDSEPFLKNYFESYNIVSTYRLTVHSLTGVDILRR